MDQLSSLLRSLITTQALSQREVARRAKIESSYLSKILNKGLMPSESVLLRLAAALQTQPKHLLRFLEDEESNSSKSTAKSPLRIALPMAAWSTSIAALLVSELSTQLSESNHPVWITCFARRTEQGTLEPVWWHTRRAQLEELVDAKTLPTLFNSPGKLRSQRNICVYSASECVQLLQDKHVDAIFVSTSAFSSEDTAFIKRCASFLESIGNTYIAVVQPQPTHEPSACIHMDELFIPARTSANLAQPYLRYQLVQPLQSKPDKDDVVLPRDHELDGWTSKDSEDLRTLVSDSFPRWLSSALEFRDVAVLTAVYKPDVHKWRVPQRIRVSVPQHALTTISTLGLFDRFSTLLSRFESNPEMQRPIGIVLFEPYISWLQTAIAQHNATMKQHHLVLQLLRPPYYAMVKGDTDRMRMSSGKSGADETSLRVLPGLWSRFELIFRASAAKSFHASPAVVHLLDLVEKACRQLRSEEQRLQHIADVAAFFDIQPRTVEEIIENMRFDIAIDLNWYIESVPGILR